MKMKNFVRFIWIFLLISSLFACATTSPSQLRMSLSYGKRAFQMGYYKRALHYLLPLACDGIPDAQYAVGYMYYNGLGVSQDKFVGQFWIQRAAEHGNKEAQNAITLINEKKI